MQLGFDAEKSINAKKECRKFGTIWKNNFAPQTKIGNCTNLYRKLNPKNYKDFYEKYLSYAEENNQLPIDERGLSYYELVSLAERYKNMCEESFNANYPLETYFYDAVCHIIMETFKGQHSEAQFSKFLTSIGYKCSTFDGKIDTEYGVDIKVERGDGKVSAIQIKPITFYKANRTDTQEDRIQLCMKYEKTLKNLGIKTYYAIYVADEKTGELSWIKNGNGFRFKINETFNYDPNDIRGTFTRLSIPNVQEKLPI